jgi:alanine-glyoxylate transaminase/serine-glyoxylate transaminase/serine-pyruvate transaminase
MGPGPSNPYPEVLLAAAQPMLGHLDPAFIELLDETNAMLRRTFCTDNDLTFPISATGSAGMEAAFVNVLAPGDVAVVGVNGVFGERMCDVASRCGAEVVRVEADWGTAIDPQALVDAHRSPKVIAVVHAETSTGVRNDVAELGAAKRGALLLVDCVTSLGGIPVAVDDWQVDLAYSGTQKCLGAPPGLSPFTASAAAVERLVPKPQSWYLDLHMISKYVSSGGARAYHHTAPISAIFGLHAALEVLLGEGLEATWERHRRCGEALQSGLESLGFDLFAEAGHRLPELTTAWVPIDRLPSGMDEAGARRWLLEVYGIEVGGGLGEYAGRVWRIGCMGNTARSRNVTLLLAALEELFKS